ncbi:ATPase [Dispira simplex]|nr:ATPase [Dispira simplex]
MTRAYRLYELSKCSLHRTRQVIYRYPSAYQLMTVRIEHSRPLNTKFTFKGQSRPYSLASSSSTTYPVLHGKPSNEHIAIEGPAATYRDLVAAGKLKSDNFQQSIVAILQDMYVQLKDYQSVLPPPAPLTPKWTNLFSWIPKTVPSPSNAPYSLYLYGDVGTGKTMLMDLLYNTLKVEKKKRIHFHSFMLDVHQRIQRYRITAGSQSDFIPIVANDLASESSVLCFDEFQVTDIVDAMILRRLFTELFNRGVVVITTSNRHPDDLYKNGLQRQSFIPCIELLKAQCRVVSLDSGTDYRRLERETAHLYFTSREQDPLLARFLQLWRAATECRPIAPHTLHFLGRDLVIPEATEGVAKMSFNQLCGQAHSTADYLELTKYYQLLFLTDVPPMDLSMKNEARRFITLVDTLYENHTILVISAACPVADLFSVDRSEHAASSIERSPASSELQDSQRLLMDDLGLSMKQLNSTLFTADEEAFAFQRALSRLVEMQSKWWVYTSHATLPPSFLNLVLKPST